MFNMSNNLGEYGLAPTAEECATIFGANIKNPKSPAFWLSAVLLVMISVFSILIHRHISWKKK